MGLLRISIGLRANRSRKVVKAVALVDTGASLTVVPLELANRIGLKGGDSVVVTIAGGRKEAMAVTSAFIRLDGREVPSTVLIAKHGEPLLGAGTLELLGATVDPKHGRIKLSNKFALMVA